jgi:hypothetical protein
LIVTKEEILNTDIERARKIEKARCIGGVYSFFIFLYLLEGHAYFTSERGLGHADIFPCPPYNLANMDIKRLIAALHFIPLNINIVTLATQMIVTATTNASGQVISSPVSRPKPEARLLSKNKTGKERQRRESFPPHITNQRVWSFLLRRFRYGLEADGLRNHTLKIFIVKSRADLIA